MEQPVSRRASVIIPVFNGEKTIRPAIESLLAQDFPNLEIIVVDDGSTDGTARIVGGFTGVVYRQQKNAGPATARNEGVRHAAGEIICFTDADCVAHKDWVTRLVRSFDRKEVGAVAGSYGIVNKENVLADCIHREILYRHEKFKSDFVRAFGSYNCAVRKDVFNGVGGFDERYRFASGEDNDLSYKILKGGYKILFDRAALVDHHHPSQIKNYLRSQFQHGYWRAKMYRDHPGMSGGDDYTFWKDMVEVAIVMLIFLASFLSLIMPPLMTLVISSLIMFSVLVISFGFVMVNKLACELYF